MKKSKKATVGERIILTTLHNITPSHSEWEYHLDNLRSPLSSEPEDVIRDGKCARKIDAAVRRAVKDAWDGRSTHDLCASLGDLESKQAGERRKSKIEARYGVKL